MREFCDFCGDTIANSEYLKLRADNQRLREALKNDREEIKQIEQEVIKAMPNYPEKEMIILSRLQMRLNLLLNGENHWNSKKALSESEASKEREG